MSHYIRGVSKKREKHVCVRSKFYGKDKNRETRVGYGDEKVRLRKSKLRKAIMKTR